MEKKFKNKFVVEGPYSLLEAFGKELRKLGYQHWVHGCGSKCILVNYDDVFKLENSYAFQDSYGSDAPIYNLPDQWHTAISAASETEEVIPEYVECIADYAKNQIWGNANIEKGRVVKVDSLRDGDSKYFYTTSPGNPDILNKNYPGQGKLDLAGTGYYSFDDFKLSTREAYEAQQNTPKYKVGQFVHSEGFKSNVPLYITGFDSSRKEYSIIVEDCSAKPIQTYPQEELERRYDPISDEKALQLLKAHYAKQGIVERAKINTRGWNDEIVRFGLVKNANSDRKNFRCEYGNSQLAIYVKGNEYWVTPTMENFKVLPKEVKVAGYPTTKTDIVWDNGMVRIGCETQGKFFTKDSLIAIKDLLSATGFEFIDFTYSPIGRIKLYKKEIEEAINLLN